MNRSFCLVQIDICSLSTQVRSLSTLVTNSLTHSCLADLADVTLAFEDAYSKLLDIVSIADVDAEEHVDDHLLKILRLRLGKDFEP